MTYTHYLNLTTFTPSGVASKPHALYSLRGRQGCGLNPFASLPYGRHPHEV